MTNSSLDPAVSPAPPSNSQAVRWAVIAIAVLFVAFFAYALVAKREAPRPSAGAAPDFSLSLFADYRGGFGDTLSLADLEGKVVVLNFWASWCDPCKEEAATLQKASVDYANRGVVFVGVDYLDQEPVALRYLKEYEITYANGPDLASQIARRYRIQGVPETFFIRADGTVDWFKIGPLSASELNNCLDQLTSGGSCK
ncbi:MAG: TlpA disulfide reductase family protein [Anaerolineae bacterium]|uniref:TlpA family protein disulfide reductase n=1 Tax=Candidatus Amarolinea dominans TaxID=3140696 RepID=UPI003134877F|nr:TlpA family protein disulfide reductase [Anaerolineae bacterium]MBK9233762.1 TlpA family protein disulfide reductase [Anaerolineae bacterium]